MAGQSDFDDLLCDLRQRTAGSSNEIRDVVSRILQNPHLDRVRREMIPSPLPQQCTQVQNVAVTRPTTTIQACSTQNASVHEEVRRCFTAPGGYVNGPHRVRQSRGRRHQPYPSQNQSKQRRGRTVSRNVTLLNKGMTTIPSKKDMMYYHKRVVNCVQFSSTMTEQELEYKIETLFKTKIEHLPRPRFHFVKLERHRVFPPLVEESFVWDGDRLLSLIGTGHVYVMANGEIPDQFDASLYTDMAEEKKSYSSSDSDELPDISILSRRVRATTTNNQARPQAPAAAVDVHVSDHDPFLPVTHEDEVILVADEDIQPPDLYINQEIVEHDVNQDIAGLITSHLDKHVSKDAKDLIISRLRPFRSFCRSFGNNEMSNIVNIQVKFFDSMNTLDDGGPRRDFLRRLLADMLKPSTGLFVQTLSGGITVTHNAAHLDQGLYYWAGRAMALIVLAGGPDISIMTPGVFDFMVKGYELAIPTVADIPSKFVRDLIEKIETAASDEDLKMAIVYEDRISMEDGTSTLLAAGISTVMKVSNVQQTVKRLIKYYALGTVRSELEALQKGLQSYKFLDLVRQYPNQMRSVLVPGSRRSVTGSDLIIMFGPVFSEEGANQRQKEEDVMEMWIEYLGLVDQGMTKITASEILRFTSGVDEVPLIGWGDGKHPMLLFDREPISPLPTSSTCGPTLILPLWSYKDLSDFSVNIETSVLCSPSILRD